MTRPENTLRHGDRFAHQFLGFFEVPQTKKGRRVVVGLGEGIKVFCAVELQVTRINLLPNARGLFASSKAIIRTRKIALRDEQVFF